MITILHFVKRDFQDYRLGWILMLGITILGLWGFVVTHGSYVLFGLAWAYGMFGMAPIQDLLGSVWRTQHQLSRYYLLSLPLPHTRLFLIQQVRIVVFCVPFILLSIALPFVLIGSVSQSVPRVILYFYNIAVSVGLFVHSFIWMALEMERVASYIPKKDRLWIHLKSAVGFLVLWGLPSFVWQTFIGGFQNSPTMNNIALVFLAVMTASLIWLFFRNRSSWCVTRATGADYFSRGSRSFSSGA